MLLYIVVMMVLWGHISPQLLQKVMALMQADLVLHGKGELDVEGISKLAGIGTNGTHPNNCWSQLKLLLPRPRLPPLHFFSVPMQHNVLGRFWRNQGVCFSTPAHSFCL